MSQRRFLALWTVAVIAAASAFIVELALRGRTMQLAYELGRTRSEQAKLREVERVLALEAASLQSPQRVEVVARTLLGMQPPPAERIVPMAGPHAEPSAAPVEPAPRAER